jgi:hydrogenase maturation protein HypF
MPGPPRSNPAPTPVRTGVDAAHASRIEVFGVVQGVGFRPFIYRLARRFGLAGWVKNIGRGVAIRIEGPDRTSLAAFAASIEREKPALARIERLTVREAAPAGLKGFRVRPSRGGESFVFISPDISVCRACLKDIREPRDRRYRYPFTNCTDCGPRYTIVRGLPYDRSRTTMSAFPMCPDCSREYHDPEDRRYHAQPVACPACGPAVRLLESATGRFVPGGIEKAADLIGRGKILAVKGLGGFHLICDPRDARAVARLRRIKERTTKPLALMAKDLDTARRWARVSPVERRLLLSAKRPIVLLAKNEDLPGIAPHLGEVGVMLPYTPLHVLLLEKLGLVVATSSNPKDAPIIKDEDESPAGLSDFLLTHNRPIHMRADDSVIKVVRGRPLIVRRARGYVPYPQRVPAALVVKPHVIALGGELKDTISVYKDGYVVTSQFLGDLDDYRNRLYFEETIAHLTKLFDVKPACVVSDLHPGFHSTRYAEGLGLPHLRIQHHFAHVLAVCLEHGVPPGEKVLGISWDGYGYGEDGSAWGGEFLIADYESASRFAHFEPHPLPGGDQAAREPWRMALSYLHALDPGRPPDLPAFAKVPARSIRGVWDMISRGVRSPLSTSCGRLFDAVAALIGLAPLANEFEAEAAMRLEAAASGRKGRGRYPFVLRPGADDRAPRVLSFLPTIRAILEDLGRGIPGPDISARFHDTLAAAATSVAKEARRKDGIDRVVLTGGVFLNRRILAGVESRLLRDGFRVLRPVEYSPNDESISVGQIAYALARIAGRRPLRTSSPDPDPSRGNRRRPGSPGKSLSESR